MAVARPTCSNPSEAGLSPARESWDSDAGGGPELTSIKEGRPDESYTVYDIVNNVDFPDLNRVG